MATRYLDIEGGTDANDATSYAQRVKTFAGLAGKVAAGDTVRIMGSLAPTALGTTTWTNASRSITIPAGTVKDVDVCDAAWTASANVTATTTTTRKQGTNAANLAIAAGFTTGLVAYKATGTIDLSAYQQLNLWIQANATVAASVFRVDLCSDAVGATPVNSFTITTPINPINTWHAIVIDNGSALGSSIASVAITALSDPATVTLIVDNIFVSKAPSAADCLTLLSLVRKTTPVADDDFWSNIVSASGTAVEIGGNIGQAIANSRTYLGATESVATQVRQPIVQAAVTTSTTLVNSVPATDGTSAAANITYSGGWDRTNMSTQDSETWLAVCNGQGIGLQPTSRKYLTFSKLRFSYFNVAVFPSGNWINFTDVGAYGPSNNGIDNNSNTQGKGHTFLRCESIGHQNVGFRVLGGNPGQHLWDTCVAYGGVSSASSSAGIAPSSPDGVCRNCRSINNGYAGFDVQQGNPDLIQYDGCMTKQNGNSAVRLQSGCEVYTRGCTFNEASVVVAQSNQHNGRLICNKFGAGADDHRIFGYLYTMTTETGANRRTASGYAYKLNLTGSRSEIEDAARVPLGRFFVRAGQTFTYTVYVNRSVSGATVRLRIPGGMDPNVTSDVVSTAASTATYEQLSVSVTPTNDLEVPVYIEIAGTNGQFAYIDDSSQAWT